MNNDEIIPELEKIDGIFDILPPVTPDLSRLEISLIILASVVSIALVIYLVWRYFYSNKGKIKHQIMKLQDAYSKDNINAHDTIYHLSQLLCSGLKIKKLNNKTTLPVKITSQKKRWLDFSKNISDTKYMNVSRDSENIHALFTESLYWLRCWS